MLKTSAMRCNCRLMGMPDDKCEARSASAKKTNTVRKKFLCLYTNSKGLMSWIEK